MNIGDLSAAKLALYLAPVSICRLSEAMIAQDTASPGACGGLIPSSFLPQQSDPRMAPLRQSKLSRPVKKRRLGRNSDDSDAAPIQFEPQNEPSSDDETEIIATRKTPASASQKRRPVVLDSDSEIEVIVAPVPEAKKRVRKKVNAAKSAPKPTKKGKGKAQPAPKRKLVKGVRPASESGSDSDDLSGERELI